MTVAVPVLLAVLALLDGCLSGFRAAAGRDARIDKRRYARASCREGAAASVLVLLALAGWCLPAVVLEPARYDDFVRAGARMLLVLGPYAGLVLAALAGYVVLPRTSWRTLMTTLVLGPFTLARPLVVVGAAVAGLTVPSAVVRTGVVLAAVLVLAVEPVLRRRRPPQVPLSPPPWRA